MTDTNGKKRLFEPVFNLGTLGVIVAGLGAFYNVKSDLASQTARYETVQLMLNERAVNVDRQLAALSAGIEAINTLVTLRTPLRYTRPDAEHDLGLVNQRLESMDQRIQRLESRPR